MCQRCLVSLGVYVVQKTSGFRSLNCLIEDYDFRRGSDHALREWVLLVDFSEQDVLVVWFVMANCSYSNTEAINGPPHQRNCPSGLILLHSI